MYQFTLGKKMSMQHKPKISVIIPVYNGEDYVRTAIDSILCQTYPAHQIIIIADGSMDSSPKILKSYGDKIVTKRISNSGISAARNAGLELVTGDYVAFLDQDDFWFKHKLAKQAEVAMKHPKVGVICCDYITRRVAGAHLYRHFPHLEIFKQISFDRVIDNAFGLLIKEHFVGTPSTVMIKKAVIDKVGGFDPRYLYTQDYDYFLRCAHEADYVVQSDTLVFKRAHDGNFSNNLVALYTEQLVLLKMTWQHFGPTIEKKHLKGFLKTTLSDTYYRLGNACYESNKKHRAFAAFFQGMASDTSFKNSLHFGRTAGRKLIRLLFETGNHMEAKITGRVSSRHIKSVKRRVVRKAHG